MTSSNPMAVRESEDPAKVKSHLSDMNFAATEIVLRTPPEPLPPPIKEPPDPPENPDAPVQEPDPTGPAQI